MRTALVQLCSGDDPVENLVQTLGFVAQAAADGAGFILTPEVTNCVSFSRSRQQAVLQSQDQDQTLVELRAQARALGVWLLIGSLALKTDDPDGRFANRSFLIGPDGEIHAWYDKIHMFDVQISEQERYFESAGYRPGTHAVLGKADFGLLGMSICYDLRFPQLYQALAKAGAMVLAVPSAFSTVTGAAHWETLLRARAIETGCFVLAPAQSGDHAVTRGKPRRTYGRSLAVSPWGEVLVDGGTMPGVYVFDMDLGMVRNARAKVPSLEHARAFGDPEKGTK